MNEKAFREGRYSYVTLDGRDFEVEHDGEFVGRVVRINPHGVQSFWNAIDLTGRIIGRYMGRTEAAEALVRKIET